jgi:hypothetical protein
MRRGLSRTNKRLPQKWMSPLQLLGYTASSIDEVLRINYVKFI